MLIKKKTKNKKKKQDEYIRSVLILKQVSQ